MDENELDNFFAVLLMIGAYRAKKEPVSNLWSKTYGRVAIQRLMSRDRFNAILRCLRFDDFEIRHNLNQAASNIDKLEPIKQLFNEWNESIKDGFFPYRNVTIDEMLVNFYGRCPFKQFMPKKPGKYGIKFWVLTDSLTAYVLNARIYTGKKNDTIERNLGEKVVLDLVQLYKGFSINVTCDNFFASRELLLKLKEMQFFLLGTMKANRKEIPRCFLPQKGREPESSLFGFTPEATIVSYCPKKNRTVLLISSNHFSRDISATKKKPQMILDYNKTKGFQFSSQTLHFKKWKNKLIF